MEWSSRRPGRARRLTRASAGGRSAGRGRCRLRMLRWSSSAECSEGAAPPVAGRMGRRLTWRPREQLPPGEAGRSGESTSTQSGLTAGAWVGVPSAPVTPWHARRPSGDGIPLLLLASSMSLLVSCVSVSDRSAVAGGALPAEAIGRHGHRLAGMDCRPVGGAAAAAVLGAPRAGEPAGLGDPPLPRCPRTRLRQPWAPPRPAPAPAADGAAAPSTSAAPPPPASAPLAVAPPPASAAAVSLGHAGPSVCLAGRSTACRQPG